jgi:hypothetical protein
MNVPNRYKGFSQLPENVQQRMDPSLANKYQMGGSVMQRPLFRQMGGPTDMMPQDMMPPPPMGGAPMPPPPMAPPPPMGVDPAMEAQLMDAENTGQQIGAQFSEDMMMNLEGAEDYQSLIDGIRGNQLPIDARYQELAGYVGEQDAMATPESVLALTQPTIMMTEQGAMDSGIGELMQGIAGDVPMEGPMDEGVGALMAAGAGNTPPVNFRNGGPVMVRNFEDGTPRGGNSSVIAKAQAMAPEYQKYFAGAMDSEARAAALAEQNEMAKAQMLFDIAGTALNFAGQTQGNTLAERLANAASQTQLTDKIGARSAGVLTAKQAQAAEDRQIRMSGLQGALGQAQADAAADRALELAKAKSTASKPVTLSAGAQLYSADGKLLATNSTVTPKTTTLSPGQSVFDANGKLIASMPAKPVTYSLSAGEAAYDAKGNLIVERAAKPQVINLAPGAIAYDVNGVEIARGEAKPATTHLLSKDQQLVDANGTVIAKGTVTRETVTLGPGQQVVNIEDGTVIAKGPPKFEAITMYLVTDKKVKKESINVATPEGLARYEELKELGFVPESGEAMAFINDEIAKDREKREEEKKKREEDRSVARETVIYGRNREAELADIDAAVVRKIAEEERAEGRTLTAEERAQITWDTRNTVTTQNDFDRLVFAQGLSDKSQLSAEDRKAIVDQNNFVRDQSAKIAQEIRAVANRDTIELREINGELVKVDTLTGETTVLFGEPEPPKPIMAQVTLRNADGVPVTTVIDINSPQGKALIEQVNAANVAVPGSARYEKTPTASTKVRGFLIPGKGVFTSYDSKTYVDEEGNTQAIPGGAFEISSTIANEVSKNEKKSVSSQAQLDELDRAIVQGMTTIDGTPLSRESMTAVRNAYEDARKGTGFWSKVRGGINAIAGGLAPEAFGEIFKDTTDARQGIKMVRIMGRSALAATPKLAVMDLLTTGELFPNEEAFFRSPKTEAAKLDNVVFYLDEEKRRILAKFASGEPLESGMKSMLNQKLFEINRLEGILGPLTLLGQVSQNADAVDNAVKSMKDARLRAKDAEIK